MILLVGGREKGDVVSPLEGARRQGKKVFSVFGGENPVSSPFFQGGGCCGQTHRLPTCGRWGEKNASHNLLKKALGVDWDEKRRPSRLELSRQEVHFPTEKKRKGNFATQPSN